VPWWGGRNVPGFDLVVVGAGMVGLATALAAAARRLRVLVIDREAQANECSWLRAPELAAVLHSMTELRVESRGRAPNCGVASAVHGVTFMRSTAVLGVEMPSVHTSQGSLRAQRVAICPGG